MSTPKDRKLITVSQFEYLQELAQTDVNSICVIFAFYESRTWMPNLSDDITYWSDTDKYAINTQDYYHYFGYDVVLPKPTKEHKGNNITFQGWWIWLQMFNPDEWQVVHSGAGGCVGTLEDCQKYIIEWFEDKVAELPMKFNFKFEK